MAPPSLSISAVTARYPFRRVERGVVETENLQNTGWNGSASGVVSGIVSKIGCVSCSAARELTVELSIEQSNSWWSWQESSALCVNDWR